jgi:hypothetical protein
LLLWLPTHVFCSCGVHSSPLNRSLRLQGTSYICWQEIFDNGVKILPDTVVDVWKGGNWQDDMAAVVRVRYVCWRDAMTANRLCFSRCELFPLFAYAGAATQSRRASSRHHAAVLVTLSVSGSAVSLSLSLSLDVCLALCSLLLCHCRSVVLALSPLSSLPQSRPLALFPLFQAKAGYHSVLSAPFYLNCACRLPARLLPPQLATDTLHVCPTPRTTPLRRMAAVSPHARSRAVVCTVCLPGLAIRPAPFFICCFYLPTCACPRMVPASTADISYGEDWPNYYNVEPSCVKLQPRRRWHVVVVVVVAAAAVVVIVLVVAITISSPRRGGCCVGGGRGVVSCLLASAQGSGAVSER